MSLPEKIFLLDDLAVKVKKLKKKNKKIVLSHGCFDLMHPGHIKHFQSAKAMGDILIVTITPDAFVDKGQGRPVFNQNLRLDSIASLACVDYVAINQWKTAVETLTLLQPDIYVKGQEFKSKKDITGKLQKEIDVSKKLGIKLNFSEEIVYSSTKLLNKHFGVFNKETLDFLNMIKEEYVFDDFVKILQRIKDLKILVIGDAIIDDYNYVYPLNKSIKSAAITSKYLFSEVGIGGALCLANHLKNFCNQITMLSVLGERESYYDLIINEYKNRVNFIPFYNSSNVTTVKRRFIEGEARHKMLEVHYYDDKPINDKLENDISNYLNKEIKNFDLVIVADFGHGMMTPKLIDQVCNQAPFLGLTVQTNSTNYGFNYVTKYKKTDYMVIDEIEIRLASHDSYTDLDPLIVKIAEKLQAKSCGITIGRKGSVLKHNGDFYKAPIVEAGMVDNVGAGDAFLAITTPLVYLNIDPKVVLFFGNLAGGVAANISGNSRSISKEELIKRMSLLFK